MGSVAIYVLSVALCLSSGFQQGYIASVLNQPYVEIERYINDSWIERTGHPISSSLLYALWSLLNVMFPASTIVGQFIAAWMVHRLGRRWTAIISASAYIPGCLICASAKWLQPAFELLYVGRIIWSIANGIAVVNATVWIVESAPVAIRGRMAAQQELFMSLGSLATQALGVPFSDSRLWPFIFIPNAAIAFANVLLFCGLHESPQFLIERNNDTVRARQALAFYHGKPIDDPSLDDEIRVCQESVEKKRRKEAAAAEHKKVKSTGSGKVTDASPSPAAAAAENGKATAQNEPEPSTFAIMFKPWVARDDRSKVIREAAWLGVIVKIAYVFTGARCLRAYSTFILHDMGGWTMNKALYGSFVIGLLRLPVTMVPILLVDRIGRRPLILLSLLISSVSLVVIMAGIELGANFKIAPMLGLTILLLINACGLGSVSRFYAAELVPRDLLLQSVSLLAQFEAVIKIVVEFAWYPLANVISAWSFFLFLAPCFAMLIFLYPRCPETANRKVHEVLDQMATRRQLKVSFNS